MTPAALSPILRPSTESHTCQVASSPINFRIDFDCFRICLLISVLFCVNSDVVHKKTEGPMSLRAFRGDEAGALEREP